ASNPPQLTDMKDLSLTSVPGTGISDASGDWTIPYGGTDVQNVTADFDSPLVKVINTAGSNESLTQAVTPGVFADFTLNPSPTELVTSQPNCHRVSVRFHDFIKSLDPNDNTMDITVRCNVNLAQVCNAYFDGSSINFFQSGGGCPNTAYSTVVAH